MSIHREEEEGLPTKPKKSKKALSSDDRRRTQALVENLVRVMLKIPATQDEEYTDRFYGVYVGDVPYEQEKSAREWGKAFRSGDKVLTIQSFVAALAKTSEHLADEFTISRKKGDDWTRKGVPVPTSKQILEALQIFTRLTPAELRRLKLSSLSQHPLLEQAFINLASVDENITIVPDVYREVYKLSRRYASKSTLSVKERKPSEKDSLPAAVKNARDRMFLQAGTGQIRYLDFDDQKKYAEKYISDEFLDSLRKSVTQNGSLRQKLPIYLDEVTVEPYGPFPFYRLSDDPESSFLSNTLLSKHNKQGIGYAPIDEQLGQLPTRKVTRVTGHFFIEFETDPEHPNYIEIKKGKGFQGFDEHTFNRLSVEDKANKKVYLSFTVSTTGIGGTHSLIAKLLNDALLSDVRCLRNQYFPVAQELMVEQETLNDRVQSPTSHHSFVQLCTHDTLAKAMAATNQKDKIVTYEKYSDHAVRGVGDYFDFDTLQGMANAGLLSRLHAIINTGIDTNTYLFDLVKRIEQQYLLDKATQHLTDYPFSCFALKSRLQTDLLNKQKEGQASEVIYNAHLLISHIFTTEGAYRNAHIHLSPVHKMLSKISQSQLDWLDDYARRDSMEDEENQSAVQDEFDNDEEEEAPDSSQEQKAPTHNVVSSIILANYELCLARYLLVLDSVAEQDSNNEKRDTELFLDLFPRDDFTPQDLVEETWKRLDRAEQHLTIHVTKYHIVDEISQTTLRPYYKLLAEIYSLRARMFWYYPNQLAPDSAIYRPPTQFKKNPSSIPLRDRAKHAVANQLYLMERARVFAACYGGRLRYTVYTAYQCRNWLMAAFSKVSAPQGFRDTGLEEGNYGKARCLAWAKRLRNHALLQYATTGRRCYHEIKEKSGLEFDEDNEFDKKWNAKHHDYGNYRVASICPIRESLKGGKIGYNSDDNVLYLDIEILAVKRGYIEDSDSTQSIYLFGPEASHLFFIRGLYHLCSNDLNEFPRQRTSKKGLKPKKARVLDKAGWQEKFKNCSLLFNYAWAIAGDGCGLDSSAKEGTLDNVEQIITRDMKGGLPPCSDDPHASSVWNLYPYRVSEIAELGKLFSAACLALCCFNQSQETQATYQDEMNRLLDSLPGGDGYSIHDSLVKSMDDQQRINGPLIQYFEQCSGIIRAVVDKTHGVTSERKVKEARDGLLVTLFKQNAL